MGVRIPEKFVYNTFQMPEPSDDEEVREPPQGGKEPSIPDTGVDSSADFSEKKTLNSGDPLKRQSQSRMEALASRLEQNAADLEAIQNGTLKMIFGPALLSRRDHSEL